MFLFHETLCLALGIGVGMIYYHRTGKACGGIITPGFAALYIHDPMALGVSFGAGLVVCWFLKGLVQVTGVFGRQRLAAAMLLALALKLPLPFLLPDSNPWLGWVLPGLMGADMDRQGVGTTLWAVVGTGIATAMAFHLGVAGLDQLRPVFFALWGDSGI